MSVICFNGSINVSALVRFVYMITLAFLANQCTYVLHILMYFGSPVRDTVVINDRWGSDTPCKHGGVYTCQDRYNLGMIRFIYTQHGP